MDIFSRKLGVLAIALFFFNAGAAFAGVFTIGSQLTGDPREENPDDILIDLTINVVNELSTWTIAIDSPETPYGKLLGFFFNLNTATTDVIAFGDTIPDGWAVEMATMQANAPGSGSAHFDFLADGNVQTRTLSFTATLNRDWTEAMFFGAPLSTGDSELGEFQVGAHVGALNILDDSGFATGNYNAVPLPSAVFLIGTGLAGLFGLRSRRKK